MSDGFENPVLAKFVMISSAAWPCHEQATPNDIFFLWD